jgi:hypothetical protein
MPVKQWEAPKAGQWKDYPTEWAMYDPDEEQRTENKERQEQGEERDARIVSHRLGCPTLVVGGR